MYRKLHSLTILLITVLLLASCTKSPETAVSAVSAARTYADYIGNGTKIAVEAGDAFGIVARDVFKAEDVRELPTVEDMLSALLAGDVNAALLSNGSSRLIMDSGDYPDFEYLIVPEDVYINRAAPVFYTKELRDKYNEWFAGVAADGTWKEIVDRWIGAPLPKQEDIPQFELSGENGVLRMCDTGSYAPLTYFDDNGKLAGFNVDMMSRFAEYMGMTLEIEIVPYEEIADYVASGKADMSACTLALTDERAKSMIFGEPSTITQAVLIVKKGGKIPYPSGIELEGAASVDRMFDVPNSKYFPVLDFYNMKSGGSLTIIENFKTFQQTTEFTCGPSCIVMLLEYYGMYDGQGDRAMYELRENKERPESMLKDLIIMLENFGDWDIYSTYDLEDPYEMPADLIINSLKEGKPVIFGDDDWGGHWKIIIGYDDMGDDITATDVLIVADPYDTTDHNQDGYAVISFERLYYNWSNRYDPDFSHNLFLIASPTQ